MKEYLFENWRRRLFAFIGSQFSVYLSFLKLRQIMKLIKYLIFIFACLLSSIVTFWLFDVYVNNTVMKTDNTYLFLLFVVLTTVVSFVLMFIGNFLPTYMEKNYNTFGKIGITIFSLLILIQGAAYVYIYSKVFTTPFTFKSITIYLMYIFFTYYYLKSNLTTLNLSYKK